MLAAFDDANSIMEMEAKHAKKFAPEHLVRACKVTEQAFEKEKPQSFLAAYADDLKRCMV
jgi:hypothetical protein